MISRPSMLRPLTAAFCASLALWLSAWAEWATWDFTQILLKAEQRYGTLGIAKNRIDAWDTLLQSSQGLGETEKLKQVNSFFNRQIRFSDDIRNWRQNDYWATPIESLVKGAGDCEDYSIAKYFTDRKSVV